MGKTLTGVWRHGQQWAQGLWCSPQVGGSLPNKWCTATALPSISWSITESSLPSLRHDQVLTHPTKFQSEQQESTQTLVEVDLPAGTDQWFKSRKTESIKCHSNPNEYSRSLSASTLKFSCRRCQASVSSLSQQIDQSIWPAVNLVLCHRFLIKRASIVSYIAAVSVCRLKIQHVPRFELIKKRFRGHVPMQHLILRDERSKSTAISEVAVWSVTNIGELVLRMLATFLTFWGLRFISNFFHHQSHFSFKHPFSSSTSADVWKLFSLGYRSLSENWFPPTWNLVRHSFAVDSEFICLFTPSCINSHTFILQLLLSCPFFLIHAVRSSSMQSGHTDVHYLMY